MALFIFTPSLFLLPPLHPFPLPYKRIGERTEICVNGFFPDYKGQARSLFTRKEMERGEGGQREKGGWPG